MIPKVSQNTDETIQVGGLQRLIVSTEIATKEKGKSREAMRCLEVLSMDPFECLLPAIPR